MGKKIFISYSHQQGEWVTKILVPCMRAGGADPHIDDERFKSGHELTAQMDAEQDTCDFSVLVLSPEYLVSKMCQHEMQRAIACKKFIGVLRVDCTVPDEIKKTLYVDLRNDKAVDKWGLLLRECEADLGATAPDWLNARDEIARYLQRGDSVNLVVSRKPGLAKPKWRELIIHIQQSNPLALGIVDLADGVAASRRGLVTEILKALGSTTPVPPKPEDLVTLAQTLSMRSNPAQIALLHFDMVMQHEDYKNDVELFAALRNLVTEKRKLILLIHSRAHFGELLPTNHPLSSITDLKTVELHGRP